jgi:hypothetical protein
LVLGTEGGLDGGVVAIFAILGFVEVCRSCKGNWYQRIRIQASKAKIASRFGAVLAIFNYFGRKLPPLTYMWSIMT